MGLTREEQAEITSIHLQGPLQIEVWLIPCIVTIVLIFIGIFVMVLTHFLKRRRKSKDEKGNYEKALTESDETLKDANEIEAIKSKKNGITRPNGHFIVLSQLN